MIFFYYNRKSMKTLQYILKDYNNLTYEHWGFLWSPQCFSLCENSSFKVVSEIGASCFCIVIIWRILLCIKSVTQEIAISISTPSPIAMKIVRLLILFHFINVTVNYPCMSINIFSEDKSYKDDLTFFCVSKVATQCKKTYQ